MNIQPNISRSASPQASGASSASTEAAAAVRRASPRGSPLLDGLPPRVAEPSSEASAQPTGTSRAGVQADSAELLAQSHRLIGTGLTRRTLALYLGWPAHRLSMLFDSQGRMKIQPQANALLAGASENARAYLAALPRVLVGQDLGILLAAMRQLRNETSAATAPADLAEACKRARMSRAALDHLFDARGLRNEALLGLPEAQQQAIASARGASVAVASQSRHAATPTDARLASPQRPAAPPQPNVGDLGSAVQQEEARLRGLLQARTLVATGLPWQQIAREVGVSLTTLRNIFTRDGELLIGRSTQAMVESRIGDLGTQFAELPRALSERDAQLLAQVLREQPSGSDALLKLRSASMGLSRPAVKYLFDSGVPMAESLAGLPGAQQALFAAAGAPASPTQGAAAGPLLPQRLLEQLDHTHAAQAGPGKDLEPLAVAQQMLALGHELPEVASATATDAALLERWFTAEGALLVRKETRPLVLGSDESLPPALAAAPRALLPGDLERIVRTVVAHASADDQTLREAAVAARVSSLAIGHLFDTAASLRERLSNLVAPQRERIMQAFEMGRAWSPHPSPNPPDTSVHTPASGPSASKANDRSAKFAQALDLLSDGLSIRQVASQIGTSRYQLQDVFTAQGELRVSRAAAELVATASPELASRLNAMPRVLYNRDIVRMQHLLDLHPGADQADLERAAVGSGMTAEARSYLLGPGVRLVDQLGSLPPKQRDQLLPLVPGLCPVPTLLYPLVKLSGPHQAPAARG